VSSSHQAEPVGGELRLDDAAIGVLAARVAELLAGQLPPPAPVPRRPGRLLSAAEVSEWWGIGRGWVYQHAGELGAIRIGDGERPRLRFDPDQVAQHLNRPPAAPPKTPPSRQAGARRSPRIRGDSPRLAFRADPELSSPNNEKRAGRRTNAPGHGAEDRASGALTSLPPHELGVGRSHPRPTPALRRR
jgi:hypothetical protein